jgi:predicted thioesterase
MPASLPAQGTTTATVGPGDTAEAYGPELPPAASTPFVLGLAELACHRAVAGELAPGDITVGTAATIEHRAPSPVGATLVASARLVERDGRRLAFDVDVRQDDVTVATVRHARAVVSRQRILDRLAAR